MNTNVVSIAEFINKSEKSLLVAQRENFKNYLTQITAYAELNKIDRKSVCERAVKGIDMSHETVQNNFGRLLRGLDNKIDITLYKSFTGVETAAKKVENGTAKVPKSGKNKGLAVVNGAAEKRQEAEELGVQTANTIAIAQISNDPKTIEYLAYCIDQGYDLELVKKAMKKVA